ncbi:RNA polymerase sigma factor SigJ [Mycobacterium sp. NPDC003449]
MAIAPELGAAASEEAAQLSMVCSARSMLLNLAYRMLGSMADAEDAVQESYVRWYMLSCRQRGEIRVPHAWLTRVITRICLDMLRSARHRRERYVGPWLPEPIPGRDSLTEPSLNSDPAECIAQDESVTMAILVILETMTPPQRAAFILHDVYGIPFHEVGEALGRSAGACRTLASAARRRVRSDGADTVDATLHADVVNRFKTAFVNGDIDRLLPLLESGVDVVTDGGGQVTAALRTIDGVDKVGRYLAGIRRLAAPMRIESAQINGRLGLVFRTAAGPVCVMSFDIAGRTVRHMWLTLNPCKLRYW